MIENLASAPCRHARAASEIVREYFDSDRSSPALLADAFDRELADGRAPRALVLHRRLGR